MPFLSRSVPRPAATTNLRPSVPWATLILGAAVGLAIAVVIAWFTGNPQVTAAFDLLHGVQSQPPSWIQTPGVALYYLATPAVVLTLSAFAVTCLSPRPRPWARRLVIGILLVLLGRYLAWRCLSTLNLATPLEGSLSLLLLVVELFGLTMSLIQMVLLLGVRDRRPQADGLEQDVRQGRYQPWVDVFIPTYDEPAFILRRTVIGCQVMDYPRKRVYLLDDTRRPEIKALAADLGCHYLTRPDNHHAKAGNLNHALGQTDGELIVCFDADFVPTSNFLRRTVGFFQQTKVGMVQTPQSFYNADPIARNLGLEGVLTPDEEVFYRQIQPMRDGSGSVVCAGTSFVVRRRALDDIGQFVTDSLSEDYFTAVRLAAQGNEIIYLNEQLSAGLAAEDIASHVAQRLRWARGTLQAFFINSNPLTIPGLNPMQRLGHLEGLMNHFGSIPRLVLLILPLVFSGLNLAPIQATTPEFLYFVLPFYLVQFTVYAWLTERSRSALLSDVYALVLVFPLAATVVQAMVRPFAKGFQVTPKGTCREGFRFNWPLAAPLVVMFVLTAISLWRNVALFVFQSAGAGGHTEGIALGWVWSAYNLGMLAVALLVLLDVPRPDPQVWLDLRRVMQIAPRGLRPGQKKAWWGVTTQLSEAGVEVALTQGATPEFPLAVGMAVDIDIAEEAIALEGIITAVGQQDESPLIRVQFGPMAPATYRTLVTTLFCRPGQWRRWHSPGELQSLGLLLRLLFWPRQRQCYRPRPTPLSQG